MTAVGSSMTIPAAVAVVAGAFLSGTSSSSLIVPFILTNHFLGAMMNLFLLTIPLLLETSTSTTHLLRQWNLVFYKGHVQGPSISIATGLTHAFAAWRSGDKRFAIAGAITVSMIPYTWIFMRNVNNGLFAASEWADEIKEGSNERVRQLVNTWSRFNAVRALFPLAGAILGMILLRQ